MNFNDRKSTSHTKVQYFTQVCRVADPHHVDVDPDPSFYFDEDPNPTLILTRIRILLLIKVMQICNH
jgi:hypothetical protein